MSTTDTRKRVRVTTDHPHATMRDSDGGAFAPVVLVDGKPLDGVVRVELDASVDAPAKIRVTLIGVDIDLEGAPEYFAKIVGPGPRKESE